MPIQERRPLTKIADVTEWDGVLSKKLGADAQDDGVDRQSSCLTFDDAGEYSGFDHDKFQARLARRRELMRDQADLVLQGILANEVTFLEFFARDKESRKRNVRAFFTQIPMMLDRKAVIYSGRLTGKTWTILWNGAHRCVNFPGSDIMVWSHDEDHVKPRFEELFDLANGDDFLTQLLSRKAGAFSRKSPFKIEWKNGFKWNGVFPGFQGRNLEQYHVNGSICDESQEINDITVQKWMPTQNRFDTTRGSIRKWFGVNSQGRTDIPFFRFTFKDPYYEGHVYVIPSWNNPREYDLQAHTDYLKEYGGSVEAAKFKQMIRGKLGDKAEGVFNQRHWENCVETSKRLAESFGLEKMPHRRRVFSSEHFERVQGNFSLLLKNPLTLPNDSEGNTRIKDMRIGMDHGHGSTTSIEVWACITCPWDKDRDIWHLLETILLNKIDTPVQTAFVHHLINREGWGLYPQVSYMGIDITGNLNVYGDLSDEGDTRYNKTNEHGHDINEYKTRLIPVHLSKTVPAMTVLEKPEGGVSKKVKLPTGDDAYQIMQPAKPFLIDRIARRMGDGNYSLPSERQDQERFSEFMGTVQTIGPNGALTFDSPRGIDHTIQSNSCFEYTLHMLDTLPQAETHLISQLYSYEEQAGGMSVWMSYDPFDGGQPQGQFDNSFANTDFFGN